MTRLVFAPKLVDNAADRAASVDGCFVWQRKRIKDDWENFATTPLTSLRSGEQYRLELHAGELRTLHVALEQLYELGREAGVPMGDVQWTPVPSSSLAAEVGRVMNANDHVERGALLRTFLDWLLGLNLVDLADQMQTMDAAQLVSFDAAVNVARLRVFISQATTLLESGTEAVWQRLLKEQSWVLSQVYAYPFVIVAGQGYVGGKLVTNRGGNVVDYVFQNPVTMNALLIEIKTPITPLLTRAPYRNNVHGATEELSGAIAQLVHDRQSLIEVYRSQIDADNPGVRAWSPRALLVAGTLTQLATEAQRRSFELLRANLRDIDVVTFDELMMKTRALMATLEGD